MATSLKALYSWMNSKVTAKKVSVHLCSVLWYDELLGQEGGSGRLSVNARSMAKPSRRSPPLQRVEQQHLTAYQPSTLVPLLDSEGFCVFSPVLDLRTVLVLLQTAVSFPAAPSSAATHRPRPTLD
ncbi:hypothetical protein SVAN01_09888 [Stagonosporopsis vannaccii]|nr:hypothetical protein SVAN01_09888 [Stagonosporopsis vannaccii]